MSGKIFLLQENEKLQALSAKDYESEALLQELLAEYPDLLAGDQINPWTYASAMRTVGERSCCRRYSAKRPCLT